MELKELIGKFKVKEFRFSLHAIEMMLKRDISEAEVEESVLNGEIIEEYPNDKYSPSCLIYGKTSSSKDLHVQCSMPPKVIIITTYEPDPTEWIDCRIRRK